MHVCSIVSFPFSSLFRLQFSWRETSSSCLLVFFLLCLSRLFSEKYRARIA
jgi:hypothetical protein